MRFFLTLALACSLLGCGDDDTSMDTGADTNTADTNTADTAIDTNAGDTDMPDTELPDTELPDTDLPDTNMLDTNMPDTNMPDTNMPDTNMPDTRDPLPGAHPDIVEIRDVPGRRPGGRSWADSYSVGSRCYCESTFDHSIGPIMVDTPVGRRTVRQVCDAIGPGPGSRGTGGEPDRPLYNDIQCGNGPANDAGDEDDCPGRVDIGREGCGHIGPRWDLSVL